MAESLELDRLKQERTEMARIACEESGQNLSDQEKAAFIDYCVTNGISKKRIRQTLVHTFIESHRRETLARQRRQRAQSFFQAFASEVEAVGLAQNSKGVFVEGQITTEVSNGPQVISSRESRKYTQLEIPSTESVNEARVFLEDLKNELREALDKSLSEAKNVLDVFVNEVLREHSAWLSDAKSYLKINSPIVAGDVAALVARLRTQVEHEVSKQKQRALNERIHQTPNATLVGRSLRRSYSVRIPFHQTFFTADVEVEKSLTSGEMQTILTVDKAQVDSVIDSTLAQTKSILVDRIAQKVSQLGNQIATLPHIELLHDQDILEVVADSFQELSRSLPKKRSRNALVQIEEKAREAKYRDDVGRLHEHRAEYADVARYYPIARDLHRQLILFVGPTNSGKTWRALNLLAEGETGAYLAPLRLLALEGQEEIEKRGKSCSFLTGEERELKEGSGFISSTIEMLNFDQVVDAVVIDEVQLLADEKRGWAWLAALVGAPAKKIIMTGSPDCIELVQRLASYLHEDLTITECQRYNQLIPDTSPARLRDVAPGTAIVAFSRRDVLDLKAVIEANSTYKVAVIYGNLSPQVRREEARRFRSGEADILVSTDAIAMGLNLPIKEVLFYTTEKFDGEGMRDLAPPEIRQIGGRAGRYGKADFGVVKALNLNSLRLIQKALADQPEMLTPPFYIAPGANHVRVIARVLETDSLERVLTFFERAMEFSDKQFTRANIDELSFLATFVDRELRQLPLTERLTIASAPVDIKSETVLFWFTERMLRAFKQDPTVINSKHDVMRDLFTEANSFTHLRASHGEELRDAEDYLKTLTVYAWLAFRYPETFPRIEECEARRELVNGFIERSLQRIADRSCPSCGKKMLPTQKFRLCDDCFRRGPSRRSDGRHSDDRQEAKRDRGDGRRQRRR